MRPSFSWGHSQRSSWIGIWCSLRSRFCECRWIQEKSNVTFCWNDKSLSIWFISVQQIASRGKRTKRRKSVTFKWTAIATSTLHILISDYWYAGMNPPGQKLISNKLIVFAFFGSESESRFWQRNPLSSTRSVNRTRTTSQTRTNHQRVSKLLANGPAILWRYRVCWVFGAAAAMHVQPAAKTETTQFSKLYIYSPDIIHAAKQSQSVIFHLFQTFFFFVFLVFIDDQGRMKSASAC